MIVAQHSFGIPCDIEPIVTLARSRKIFLLEDCALALGSTIAGVAVGNFGDAAFFSTDHSKPLNTLTGGLVYTRDVHLTRRLLEAQTVAPDLPAPKQQALWRRFLLERRYCRPARHGRMSVIELIEAGKSKLFKRTRPFLSEDSSAAPVSSYPYPARLPGFLAAVGVREIKRWPQVSVDRKELLRKLLELAAKSGMGSHIPKAYFDKRLEIVPLRFAWSQPDGASVRDSLSRFILVSWTWFLQPIIATAEPLESLGYRKGACPISEHVGRGMVNLPCNLSRNDSEKLLGLFGAALSPH
jgi:dTDP-4-amino-4,6-dideoxygalactose transaminase